MIPWSTIHAAISTWVADASGVTDVRWKWQPSAMRKSVKIDLARSPLTPIGVDERRAEYIAAVVDPPAVARRTGTQVGQRSFRLTVRCESWLGAPSDSSQQAAEDALALMLLRMRRPTALDGLHAAGCALSSAGPITVLDYKVDGRAMGAAVLEIVMLVGDVDDAQDDDFIESATTTAHLS
jgi:hypothetical protein